MTTVRISGAALTEGIEDHDVDGVRVCVMSAARTVVDCFKCRTKIGVDVAVEALRDYGRLRKGAADDLWRHAEQLRVARVHFVGTRRRVGTSRSPTR